MAADTTSVSDLDVRDMHKLSDHKCIDFDLPYSVTQKGIRRAPSRRRQPLSLASRYMRLAVASHSSVRVATAAKCHVTTPTNMVIFVLSM